MSSDPNLAEFRQRVARLRQEHAQGRGFEANGTLGRSRHPASGQRRLTLWKPLLVVLLCGIGLKAVIHAQVGARRYDQRVAGLWQGEPVERLGAVLMQADPATRFLSAQLRQLLPAGFQALPTERPRP